MFNSSKLRTTIFISIALFTFTVWFADGYLQWVNSDTAGEAYGAIQQIAFPQGLVSQKLMHARITNAILSYVPFHTVGYLFREITNNPVTALYVSQGVMTGVIFMLLILMSAAYISTPASILSSKYLVSATILMLLIMAMPILPLNAPISLVLRHGHQSVMSNYIGTMVIALFALFPYWRYLFSGKWDDWYNDSKYKTAFYILLIAAVFSTTATMIWLGAFALATFLLIAYRTICENRGHINIKEVIKRILQNSRIHPLMLIIILILIGIIAERTTARGNSAFAHTEFFEYLKVYVSFFLSNSMLWGVIIILRNYILDKPIN